MILTDFSPPSFFYSKIAENGTREKGDFQYGTERDHTGDIVLAVMNWLYSKCYQAENIVTKNWINIPYFEGYRLLAQMYAKELIDIVILQGCCISCIPEIWRMIRSKSLTG